MIVIISYHGTKKRFFCTCPTIVQITSRPLVRFTYIFFNNNINIYSMQTLLDSRTMRLIINRPQSNDEQKELHLLPCKIHPRKRTADNQTLTAPVDRYFRPYTKTSVTAGPTTDVNDEKKFSVDTTLWHASLRGKPLKGTKLVMPDGYVGVLCSGSNNEVNKGNSVTAANSVNHEKTGRVTQQLMYWNWDRVPTREDPLLAALDWICVSEAIMKNSN